MRLSKIVNWLPVVATIANLSKDNGTKVGAVAFTDDEDVLSIGYNGLPRAVHSVPERLERPEKYLWTAHAEENMVAQAARKGVSLVGSTVLITPLYPCMTCARLMIQAGVKNIVVNSHGPVQPKWLDEQEKALTMLKEAGISCTNIMDI